MTSPLFDLIHDTAERFLMDVSGQQNWVAFDQSGVSPGLIDNMRATGLCCAGLPEAQGGAGLSLLEVMKLVQLSGYHACPLPFSESLVGHWIAGLAKFDLPEDAILTFADDKDPTSLQLTNDGRATGVLRQVAFGDVATHVLCSAKDVNGEAVLLCIEAAALNDFIRTRPDLAKRPLVDFQLNSSSTMAAYPARKIAEDWDLRAVGALMRSFEMAGAMRRAVEMTVNYVKERKQFGRPVAKFQAVQHMLAIAAEHAAATETSAQSAALAVFGSNDMLLKIAASKAWASKSVKIVADACHQSHGAMGFTQEYHLHYFTRRLWAWREEFGSEFEWQRVIGDTALDAGSGALWDLVIGHPLSEANQPAGQ
ncbi:acyl-CoA dehydrogenase [Ruegeria arenilitoris]|uniref:acyl-CoA dehydrogenase n=1 Tax=Ruegeria arenilitoris TaxID=1173585 RepID=UPI0014805B9F|nr:acyl-CoA dehydrogenase [Ruegeria arenilitoris]